jgi:hypothetical protein
LAVICVALVTTTFVAAVPPNVTPAPAWNPVPVIVTAVPPLVGPLVGDTLLTLGAALGGPLLGTIVVSFFNAPGELLKYVTGDNTIWSIDSPSSLTCTLKVCVPVAWK